MPSDWTSAPYSRVYRTLQDDYPAVWSDDHLLAWYVRLLDVANGTHPAAAPWPRSIPDETMMALVASGAVDGVGTTAYRIHGLARLRTGYASRGLAGGLARAAHAPRDERGRLLARDAGPVAGRTNGDAGGLTLDDTLDPATLASSDPHQRPSESNRGKDVPRPPSSGGGTSVESESRPRETTTPSAVALATGPAPDDPAPPAGSRGGSRYGPFNGRCDDPDAHGADHRYIVGVGWKCLTCEQAKAADEPSFRDRMRDHGANF